MSSASYAIVVLGPRGAGLFQSCDIVADRRPGRAGKDAPTAFPNAPEYGTIPA